MKQAFHTLCPEPRHHLDLSLAFPRHALCIRYTRILVYPTRLHPEKAKKEMMAQIEEIRAHEGQDG